MAAALELRGVTQVFRSPGSGQPFVALSDLDLTIESGQFVTLIGPSGCGKSTVLNLAAGLLSPTLGEVRYGGRVLDAINVKAGYITQQDNLLPWRNLAHNMEIALEIRGVPRAERRREVQLWLTRLGLDGFASHYPAQLSGGMRKRASLGRSLIYGPETLLMDEPFGPLDAMLRATLQDELLNLWQRDQKTVIFVTHDLEEAILLSDVVVVFGTRPGRIVHVEPIDLPRPRNLRDLRMTEEFGDLWQKMWELIQQQMPSGSEGGPAMGAP